MHRSVGEHCCIRILHYRWGAEKQRTVRPCMWTPKSCSRRMGESNQKRQTSSVQRYTTKLMASMAPIHHNRKLCCSESETTRTREHITMYYLINYKSNVWVIKLTLLIIHETITNMYIISQFVLGQHFPYHLEWDLHHKQPQHTN